MHTTKELGKYNTNFFTNEELKVLNLFENIVIIGSELKIKNRPYRNKGCTYSFNNWVIFVSLPEVIDSTLRRFK